MSIKLITGHKASNHIASSDAGTVNSALFASGNYIVADSQSVTLSVDALTGNASVGAFTALFSGREVVCTGTSGTYTTPASASFYRHVSVGILYEKDTDNDNVEECTLAVYTSDTDRSTAEEAAADSTGIPANDTIDAETAEAYMELFDFVVSGTSVYTPSADRAVYSTIPSRTGIIGSVEDVADDVTALNTWKSTLLVNIPYDYEGTDTYKIITDSLSVHYDFFVVYLVYEAENPVYTGHTSFIVYNTSAFDSQVFPIVYFIKDPETTSAKARIFKHNNAGVEDLEIEYHDVDYTDAERSITTATKIFGVKLT